MFYHLISLVAKSISKLLSLDEKKTNRTNGYTKANYNTKFNFTIEGENV